MRYKRYPYLKKHENGVYYGYYVDAAGARQRRSLRTRDQVQALAKFTQLLRDVDRGVLGFSRLPQKLPFQEIVVLYQKDGVLDLSPATIDRHNFCFKNHLIPHFKKISIKAITPKRILNYIRQRQRAGVAPNTIHKELAALSAVFSFAVQEEILLHNPVLAVKKPKLKRVRPNYTPTRQELLKILNVLPVESRRFFLALCNTGCRIGELRQANIQDADLENGQLHVTRKGGKRDTIPMNDTLKACLEEELSAREILSPGDPLFLNRYGKRYRSIRGALTTACKRIGVRHCTHHSLRHAYATILHDQGEDVGTISKLLGHTNPTVTQNINIEWKDAKVKEAAEKVSIGKVQKKCKERDSA